MRLGSGVDFKGTQDDLERLQALAEAGCQYVQPSVSCLHLQSDPADYYAVRRAFHRACVAPEVFSWVMPATMPVVGDEVNWRAVEKYVALLLDRVEELGATTIALGRLARLPMPSGYPHDDATGQLRYLMNMAADYAGTVTIALGPGLLGPVAPLADLHDAVDFLRELGRPEVRLLLESDAAVGLGPVTEQADDTGDLLHHIHWIPPDDQGAEPEVGFPAQFADLRQASAYDGRFTILAGPTADHDHALALLKAMGQLLQ